MSLLKDGKFIPFVNKGDFFAELLNTGGFSSSELDSALAQHGIDVYRVTESEFIKAGTDLVNLVNEGALSPNPIKEARQFNDLTILAEAKALKLNVFTNNERDFQVIAKGGGRLAEKLGVGVIRTKNLDELVPKRVFPRLVDAIKTLVRKIP